MTVPAFVSTLLALQYEADPTKAQSLIDSLDPVLRRRVQPEWDELRAATVVRLEAS